MMVFILFCLPIWPLQKTWWTLKDVRLPQTQPSSSSNFGFGARCDIIGRVDQHNIRYIVCSFVVTNLENSFFSVYSEKSIRKYIFIEQIIECFYISPQLQYLFFYPLAHLNSPTLCKPLSLLSTCPWPSSASSTYSQPLSTLTCITYQHYGLLCDR